MLTLNGVTVSAAADTPAFLERFDIRHDGKFVLGPWLLTITGEPA